MTAREVIDEVAGLRIRATVRIPGSVYGGASLVGTGEVSTELVPYDLLRTWVRGLVVSSTDHKDFDGFTRPRVVEKLVSAVVDDLNRKYPVVMRSNKQIAVREFVSRRLVWPTSSAPNFVQFEWVNSNGTPADLRPYEADWTRGLLGEGGYADLYGDLCAEAQVTVKIDDFGHSTKIYEFPVRLKLNRHVEWNSAEQWAGDWIYNSFRHGKPNTDALIMDPEDVDALSHHQSVRLHSVGPIKWVHADGTPYNTQPLHRRFFKHRLGEADEGVVDHMKLWIEVFLEQLGELKPHYVETIEYDLNQPLVGEIQHSKTCTSIRYLTPNVIMDRRFDSQWWVPAFNNDLAEDRPELFHYGTSFKLRKIEYYDKHNQVLDPREVDGDGVRYMLNKKAT